MRPVRAPVASGVIARRDRERDRWDPTAAPIPRERTILGRGVQRPIATNASVDEDLVGGAAARFCASLVPFDRKSRAKAVVMGIEEFVGRLRDSGELRRGLPNSVIRLILDSRAEDSEDGTADSGPFEQRAPAAVIDLRAIVVEVSARTGAGRGTSTAGSVGAGSNDGNSGSRPPRVPSSTPLGGSSRRADSRPPLPGLSTKLRSVAG